MAPILEQIRYVLGPIVDVAVLEYNPPLGISLLKRPPTRAASCVDLGFDVCAGPDLHVDASDSIVCVVSCGVYLDNTYIVIIMHILYIGM